MIDQLLRLAILTDFALMELWEDYKAANADGTLESFIADNRSLLLTQVKD